MLDREKTREQLLIEIHELRRQLAEKEAPGSNPVSVCEDPDAADCASRHLVDGKYGIRDLVDIEGLRRLFAAFSAISGFTAGLVEYPMQRVLIATGWRDICAKYHRACPESLRQCKKSNALLTEKLKEYLRLSIHECENGLMDGATPIIIKGKHIASITTGQVFFQRPHLEYFRQQAESFGFDQQGYLDAVSKVPVISQTQFRSVLNFLNQLAMMIVELGMNNLEIRETLIELEEEIRERKRTEKALQQSSSQLRLLSSRLLMAQEEERKRIAAELHDCLGSYLTAIRFALETARKQLGRGKASPGCLDSPISEMERLIGEVRRIWMDLRPSILDSRGLAPALEWLVGNYRMSRPDITIEREFYLDDGNVSETQKIVIFRIAQEAFNNINKHSNADHARISLKKGEEFLELAIEDNGDGFNCEHAHSVENHDGIGLTSMRERAELCGGSFFVDSSPGQGTRIRVRWPV